MSRQVGYAALAAATALIDHGRVGLREFAEHDSRSIGLDTA